MKIAAVIAEYNPFHNGHQYHLEKTRQLTGADYVVAVMSGDFVQRGGPAVIGKEERAKMALSNGADLVLELPAAYAAGSAEFFAMGAVTLLDKLGCMDFLCFGSEYGQIKPLSQIASLLLKEPAEYRTALQQHVKAGHSFPKARSLALQSCLPEGTDAGIAASPNNILGIEYLKALQKRNSPILPLTIQRTGKGYHDLSLDDSRNNGTDPTEPPISSASAIRRQIAETGKLSDIRAHVPESVYRQLTAQQGKCFPVTSDDFSSLLFYKLLLEKEKGFSRYQDMTPALSDKIRKNLNRFQSFETFCGLLKSKNMTYSRISRCLTHILLDMTADCLESYTAEDVIFYARILGFRRESGGLLAALKANTSVPLIPKLADARTYLNGTAIAMLEKDIQAAHIYNAAAASKFHGTFLNEYAKSPVIL